MSDKKILALGYFDSLHLGHQQVISLAQKVAKANGVDLSVFTFDGNLKKALYNQEDKRVFTNSERSDIFAELGVKDVFYAPVTPEFLSLNEREFLDYLNSKMQIIGYVCGEDYRFGKNGNGNVDFLKKYASVNGQLVDVAKTFMLNQEKVSTTSIKRLLALGQVCNANKLLGRNFFVDGEVFEDRKVGTKIGFPTINVKLDEEKATLKKGVYYGHVFLNKQKYKTIINYGERPTFNLNKTVLEAHIIDFSGDLYGKKVRLFFNGFLREIVQFTNVLELKTQLAKDMQAVKGKVYD